MTDHKPRVTDATDAPVADYADMMTASNIKRTSITVLTPGSQS
jgi:hypothetical protein